MARAKAICECKVCGGRFEKIRYNCYNREQANSWEEWAVSYFDECPDCYEKRKAEELKQEAKEAGLPELEGTERQIKWANEIRKKMVDKLNQYYKVSIFAKKFSDCEAYVNAVDVKAKYNTLLTLFEEGTEEEEFISDASISERVMMVMSQINYGEKWDIFEAAVSDIKNQSSARFWIDNRMEYMDRMDAVKELVKRTVERLEAKAKPAAVEEKPEEKKNDKIIYIRNGGRYDGWFWIRWKDYDEELYKAAREIDASYYDKPGVAVALKSVKALVEFAEKNGFEFSEKAQKVVEKELVEADEREKREAEAKKTEPERTVCIRYKDYKNGVFAGKVQRTGEYFRRDRTIEVVMYTVEDAEFARDYYDKNKKQVSDELKKSQFKSGEIDEYEITPAKIDADSLIVEVPEELKNVNTAAG